MGKESAAGGRFSTSAGAYARYRPGYPADLFRYLAGLCSGRRRAWDCATGTGQAAAGLAAHFEEVVGTDASAGQIARAPSRPGIRFRVAPAEAAPLGDGSVDLVTVAQALHWLPLEPFFREVERVLVPGGVFAAWCYSFPAIGGRSDEPFRRFHTGILGPYWAPARRAVDSGYRDLPFPFRELEEPPFRMEADWSLERFLGYVGTWSAVRSFRTGTGSDPVPALREELGRDWSAGETRRVTWPFHLRVGRR